MSEDIKSKFRKYAQLNAIVVYFSHPNLIDKRKINELFAEINKELDELLEYKQFHENIYKKYGK